MDQSTISVGIAFAAGVLSFLSPCVLPLVPGYISLMSGVSIDQLTTSGRVGARRAIIVNSLAFNVGLSAIFLTLGATAGWLGASVTSLPWIRITGGLVIIAFGLQLVGVLRVPALYRDTRFFSSATRRGPVGSLILGVAFAAGWTPCIGPILGGIIGLAATSGGWRGGLLLSAFYSAGLAIPFLLTGLGLDRFLGLYSSFRRHLHKVELTSGVVLIAVGALVASGYSTVLTSSRLAGVLPNLEGRLLAPTSAIAATPPAEASHAIVLPNIEFHALDGASFRVTELRGHVVLLNFWATWCLPCRDEIPVLNALQRDLGAQGLEIVGASLDDGVATIAAHQASRRRLDYTVVVGDKSAKAAFGASLLPVTYVIGRDGSVRDRIIGARDRAGWEAVVTPLLAER